MNQLGNSTADIKTKELQHIQSAYDEQGYVILPLDSPLSLLNESELEVLRQASQRAIDRTRLGDWPHRRVVGKQFPPFDTDEALPDVWGVQHLMHYDLREPEFAKWYGNENLVIVMSKLLGCDESEVQMELFNLLINPSRHEFALRWHRDDVPEDADEAEEYRILNMSHYGVQWNTALYDDECLYVVPRSHTINSTPTQRGLSTTANIPGDPLQMPGSIQVKLKAGDTVIYNNNILHTGKYTASDHTSRATLHACMGSTRGGSARARNILQHGLKWMRDEQFVDTFSKTDKMDPAVESVGGERERLVRMWELLMAMEKGAGDVGYSQKN